MPSSRTRYVGRWITAIAMPVSATCHAEDELWQRLTEREDKRRPLERWSVEVAGRPLIVGGEYELMFDRLHDTVDAEPYSQVDRLLLDSGLEAEAFYAFAPPFAVFAQLRLGLSEELLASSSEGVSDLEIERGEMWLYGEGLLPNRDGVRVNADLGRLHFEDERRWMRSWMPSVSRSKARRPTSPSPRLANWRRAPPPTTTSMRSTRASCG